MTAIQGQQAAERMLKDVKAQHKADIETRVSHYASLQAQVGVLSPAPFAYSDAASPAKFPPGEDSNTIMLAGHRPCGSQ